MLVHSWAHCITNAVGGCASSYQVWITSRMRVKEEKVLCGLSHEIIRETDRIQPTDC